VVPDVRRPGMKRSSKNLTLIASLVRAHLPLAASAQAPASAGTAGTPVAPGTPSPQAISLYNLGLTAYKQGSPESAIIFFKRACDIDPDLADAQYNLGVLYQSQRRLKEAAPRFEEVLRVKPNDPDAQYQLTSCLCDLGRGGDARTHLNAVPPNNQHFGDAQKRLSQIDSGQAPSTSTGDVPTQPAPLVTQQPPSQPSYTAPNTTQPAQTET